MAGLLDDPRFGDGRTLSAYQPTLRERATDYVRGLLFSDDREGQQKADRLVNVGETVLPPFGFATGMYDMGRAGGEGDYLTAGTIGAMAMMPGGKKGIRAYHGSPHSFDKFSMSKIGTGEGAQAYGHGLYFAENENIAKSYRETLAGKHKPSSFEVGGVDAWENYDNLPLETKRGVGELHARLSPYKDPSSPDLIAQTQRGLENTIKNYESGAIPMDERGYEDAKAALKVLTDGGFRVRPAETPGSMYEVEINADPDTFLDWDKPLSEQPPNVQAVLGSGNDIAATRLGNAYRNEMFGGDIVGKDRATPSEVSRALADKGIPGIKYLDAGSRGAGDGTRNYVVFDDSLIEILRKYGIAGLLGATGALNQLTADEAQAGAI